MDIASPPRATIENWMQPPHNRWAFRHVPELIPSARIRAGTASPLSPAPLAGLLDARIVPTDDGPAVLSTYLENTYTDALVVLAEGALALEWYAPGVEDYEPHILMSVTKSITALLAGALIGAGYLDADQPVTRYVPEAAGSCFEDATVQHVLDMTVGTAFVEDYSPGEDVRAYRRTTGWYPREGAGPGLHEYLCSIGRKGAHGGDFVYVSPNTDMLGWVCERARGLRYADAVSEHLWVPLGAEADADVTVDRLGAARAAGGMCIIARDMARVGQLVVDDGAGVVPAEFVRALRDGGRPATGTDLAMFPGGAYVNSWYQPRWEPGVALAIGIHGQFIYADADRRVVVARQSSWPQPSIEADELLATRACQAIAHTIAGR